MSVSTSMYHEPYLYSWPPIS